MEIQNLMQISKSYMSSNKNYQPLMGGIIYRRNASKFLNIRVDFSNKNKCLLQLETVGSGFIDTLKCNKIKDLLDLEKMFGLLD